MNQADYSYGRLTRSVLSVAIVAVLIILVLLPSLALAAGFPLSPSDTAINNALDFLRDAQQPNGNIGGFAISAWAVMAIAAAGEDPHEWGDPSVVDYLRNNSSSISPDVATDWERSILAICAAGEDPTSFGGVDYVAGLKARWDGVNNQMGDPDLINDDFWGVLALIAAGESPSSTYIQGMVDFIKANQGFDGGWSYLPVTDSGWSGSDVDNTAAAMMALAAANDMDPSVIDMAVIFLEYSQNLDGGFASVWGGESNSASTSWAIAGLVAAGENPTQWEWDDNPVGYLLSLQNTDGSFNYTADSSSYAEWMTAYAIPALLGDPYPVTSVEWQPSQSDGPDLAVTGVNVPATLYVGTPATITATITNIGDEDITNSFTASLLVDGILAGTTAVPPLNAGSSSQVTLYWAPSYAGDCTLSFSADSSGTIVESNEANNEYSTDVEVTEQSEGADVIVSDITVPAALNEAVTATVTATITNIGDEDISDSFVITLKVDDMTVDSTMLTELSADSTTSVDFDWLPTTSGSYTLSVIADSGSAIDESSEDNNEYRIQAAVGGQPQLDLTVTDIAVPATIYPDVAATITATIANIGYEDIGNSFGVELRVNGVTVDSDTVTALNAGSTASVNFDWTPTVSGNYTLGVIADSGGTIGESNETNNDFTLQTTVSPSGSNTSPGVNPTISVSVEPTNADFGELAPGETSAELEITITNNGNKDMLLTADLAGDAQDFYAATLRLDDQPWGAFEVVVPQNSLVVIRASLSVPQSYDGPIMEGGVLIFWATTAS